MAETEKKFEVTQEQINSALLEASAKEAVVAATAGSRASFWQITEGTKEILGLHVRSNQIFGILLGKKLEIKDRFVLKAGYDQPDKITEEVSKLLAKIGSQTPAVLTLSGKHTHFLMTKAPQLTRSMLQKTFKLQMKQLNGEERENLPFLELPEVASGEKQKNYIVGTVHPPTQEKLLEAFRRAKLKVMAWDIDILCYARATQFLWQNSQISGETIFSLIIGSNRSRILLMTENGRLIAPILPFGISSFVEHLASALGDPSAGTQWLDEKKLVLSASDSKEQRQQKILANQALFTLYVPLAQQIKMHLYQTCNSLNLDLPKHFSVLGPGANLFRIGQCLEMDLGIKSIEFASLLEPEMAAALGAATWDKHSLKMNTLPKSGGELLQKLKEQLQTFQDKINKHLPPKKHSVASNTFQFSKKMKLAALFIVLVAIFTGVKRFSTSKELARKKAELETFSAQKEQFLAFAKRQSNLEMKQALLKVLQAKRIKMTPIIKEVLFSLPAPIRLSNFSIKEGMINIKGFSKTQQDLESFLEQCNSYQTLENPIPVNIRREKEATGFEITLKTRG